MPRSIGRLLVHVAVRTPFGRCHEALPWNAIVWRYCGGVTSHPEGTKYNVATRVDRLSWRSYIFGGAAGEGGAVAVNLKGSTDFPNPTCTVTSTLDPGGNFAPLIAMVRM